MTLRSDIHVALEPVTPPAPHLRHVVMAAVRTSPRRSRGWPRPAAAVAGVLVVAALAAISITLVIQLRAQPASAPPTRVHLTITTWERDPTVQAGPHPGYRPRLTALNESSVVTARAERDSESNGWQVRVQLTNDATAMFAAITTQAVSACSLDCPERHVAIWANLTPSDVAEWNQRAMTASMPYSKGGKLLIDAYTIQPITSGNLAITGPLSQEQAEHLADALNG